MIPLALTIVALLAAADGGVTELLQYDRAAILDGQVWRVFTGHFTHWNADHLLWDAAVFTVFGWLCERRARRRFLAATFGSSLAISVAMMWAAPEIQLYRGLSGIDSALFALLAVVVLRERWSERDWAWVGAVGAVIAGFVAKLAFEAVTGQTLFVDSGAAGFTPVVLAHVVGAVVGGVVGILGVRGIAKPRAAQARPRASQRSSGIFRTAAARKTTAAPTPLAPSSRAIT